MSSSATIVWLLAGMKLWPCTPLWNDIHSPCTRRICCNNAVFCLALCLLFLLNILARGDMHTSHILVLSPGASIFPTNSRQRGRQNTMQMQQRQPMQREWMSFQGRAQGQSPIPASSGTIIVKLNSRAYPSNCDSSTTMLMLTA